MENFITATFAGFLFTIALIDLKTKMIYDKILILFSLTGFFFDVQNWLIPLDEGILFSALGFTVMLIIFKLSSGGMGGGDVKFSAALGLWLGSKLFSAILTASILAAIVAIFLYLKTHNSKLEIPFGPFLSIGAIISYLCSAM